MIKRLWYIITWPSAVLVSILLFGYSYYNIFGWKLLGWL